ncbi:hypothetical protein KGD82_26775 [Nocardiopsis eucommiae]|uniref:Uncharacterized protein n=1 Tax=Nocardiopsis eucommiae TaxID=2831970 RepID=A0A975QMB9_9ACTN|nr:hypothetical protein KGD82_26775 [Nocardiopsis eucommiae]
MPARHRPGVPPRPENQTLHVALLSLFKPDENNWGGIMAGPVLMTLTGRLTSRPDPGQE